ncbi:hypothetical protein MNBD_CHLOROFLEXI01-1798 [hydrothermal vent metagenome]|uniref:Uncharacterized protein n=1 Tax=hydrothermal vent metagenome TaxID=652676 RepID=A0A3B0VHA2_9ZZZZ
MTQPSTNPSEPPKSGKYSDAIKVFLTAVVVGFSMLIGMFAGNFYYDETVKPTPEWQILGSPPEPIVEFVDVNFFTVFVRAKGNQLYSCYWESPYANDCWNAVEKVPESIDYCDGWDLIEPELPEFRNPSFDKVAESTYDNDCFTWAGSSHVSLAIYHLLDNGDVMQWYEDETTLSFHGYLRKRLLNISVGMVTGITVGIFISLKIWGSTKV